MHGYKQTFNFRSTLRGAAPLLNRSEEITDVAAVPPLSHLPKDPVGLPAGQASMLVQSNVKPHPRRIDGRAHQQLMLPT